MAGIYIHIPFCRKACHYCNFHFSTSLRLQQSLINALVHELYLRHTFLHGERVDTLYFGGGTPSLLEPEDIDRLLGAIHELFTVSDQAEITLEANPEDVKPEKLRAWHTMGINRLSIGLQGFQDDMLNAWNRNHLSIDAENAIKNAKEAGFDNISADLIYGDPLLTDADWMANLEKVIQYRIPHLSCYALTVETNTALHHQIEHGRTKAPDDEQSLRQFEILQRVTHEHGYEQYEISNFALPGFRSRHNTSYWKGIPYLGIGPSAHSFDGKKRQWNIANNSVYIQTIEKGQLSLEEELITAEIRYNELVMTGLRTREGIEVQKIEVLGERFINFLEKKIKPPLDRGQIVKLENGNYAVATDQYFFADGMAAGLFYDLDRP